MWRTKIFVFFFVMLFAGCNRDSSIQNPSQEEPQEPDKNYIILRVEDSVYFNSDFRRYLQFSLGSEYENLSDLSLSRLADDFVKEKLFLAEARNREVVLTQEEKKRFLAKHSSDSVIGGENWPLDEEGAGLLFEQLLVEKYTYMLVRDVEVEDREIQDYYTEHKREFLLPERVKVSQILLPSEEKAVEVLERLKDGDPETFTNLAKAHSIGAEASKGGEMGLFAIGQLPDEMEKVIFALKEDEVSLVWESSYGFHIFRLDARYEPELISPGQAAASIEVKILSQKVKERIALHLENLKNTLQWEFYSQNLDFPYQRISDE